MNEINDLRGIWRGKRVDNGVWVKGLLVKMWGEAHLQDKENENCMIQVDPETLGECTGLPDKNVKPIFEGDLCTVTAPHFNIINEIGVVKYDKQRAMFIIVFGKFMCDFSNIELIEVIGNIHDNPELLKGRK